MRRNNLTPNKGLSLSQAGSISNLCNQRARDIASKLVNINNYSKKVTVEGKEHEIQKGSPLPDNVLELLTEKSKLHACQAFLMENIKAKDSGLKILKVGHPITKDVVFPELPEYVAPDLLREVQEEWGWEQLSVAELNEFREAEAYASHIGQFIHKDSTLDHLRNELPAVPAIDWMEIVKGVKSPVVITPHHTPEKLLELHEKLAALHRTHEQKVNYVKAKVKNLVTDENARIAKHNADEQNEANTTNEGLDKEYTAAHNIANNEVLVLKRKYEKERQADIKKLASARIEVDPRFQEVIDLFLKQVTEQ